MSAALPPANWILNLSKWSPVPGAGSAATIIPVFCVNMSMASWVFLMRASPPQKDQRTTETPGPAELWLLPVAKTTVHAKTSTAKSNVILFMLTSG